MKAIRAKTISRTIRTAALMLATTLNPMALAGDGGDPKHQPAAAISSTKVFDGIYMLSGEGGNIGVLVGSDGSFMIDDKFAPLSKAIVKAIEAAGGKSPEYLINTHFHADHSGGNENFGKAGSTIIAHHNVRARLKTETVVAAFGMTTPPQPAIALPVVTFADGIRLHLNGQTINITHVPSAHTDGDAVVHFVEANTIHAGDVFFNGMFPFIDTAHGGSLQGMIDAVDRILSLSNADTKIIPGHGPLASKSDLQAYRNMLAASQKRLGALKKRGMKAKDMIANQPLKDMEERWGSGPFKADRWIEVIYEGI